MGPQGSNTVTWAQFRIDSMDSHREMSQVKFPGSNLLTESLDIQRLSTDTTSPLYQCIQVDENTLKKVVVLLSHSEDEQARTTFCCLTIRLMVEYIQH